MKKTTALIAFVISFLTIMVVAACISNYKQMQRVKSEKRKMSIYQDCIELCILYKENKSDLFQCVSRCNSFNRYKSDSRPTITNPKKDGKDLIYIYER